MDATTPDSVEQLDDLLSTPNEYVVRAMSELDGDLIILGVGGKMGPTLARMAKRASDEAGVKRRVLGVSRFSSPATREQLEACGVETVACDLLDQAALKELPDAPNVVCMTGLKFGASADPSLTWAMNCYLPALISQRYRHSRIAAFSSGNVYGTVDVGSGGSVETDSLNPIGEYAITVLGRERMFDYFSRELNVSTALLRLNYATELRYGVLVDLAQQVDAEQPIDLSMSYANVIWQSEANAMALVSLLHTAAPARVFNIAGSEILRVRDVCEQFSKLMTKRVQFVGEESPHAMLNNATASYADLGNPTMTSEQMIRWTADWVARGGESLGKPTHFESRDGRF
ncbi:MAG: epimerase [Planctomycetaceae bacterium]|nr:epimerase [Planctomycetaceae bacterium]